MHTFKLSSFIFFVFLLSSCGKKEISDPEQSQNICENITLTVNNLLPKDLDEIVIGNQNFGTVSASQTEILCLDVGMGYEFESNFLMLFLQAEYDNEMVYDGYFCGTGLIEISTGEYEIDITEVNPPMINYIFK